MLALLTLLGCAPKYAHLDPIGPEDLYSPLPVQTVDVYGVDVAYVDSGGDGPPLVFVHGLSSYLGFWEHQIEAFKDDYRVIALDLPGFGQSARPDAPYTPPWYADVVAGFLRELDLREATIVGHSMGGQIALTLALEHPEMVTGLVLSAPAGFERFEPGHAALIKEFWHEERALRSSEVEIRASFTQAVFNTRGDGVERLIEERVRLGRSPEFRGTSVAVSRAIAGMVDHPVVDRLGEIEVPALIVYGTDDKMIPNPVFNGGRTATVAQAGHEALRGAELVLIPGAGHTVHYDAPEAFDEAMADWLRRQRKGGGSGASRRSAR